MHTENVSINKVSVEALFYCKQVMNAIDENEEVAHIDYSPTDTIDILVKKIILDIVEVGAEDNSNSESTFVDKYIMPFVKKILLRNQNVVYSVVDGYDHNSDKKPDVTVGFMTKQKTVNVINFEVKRPDVSSKYQSENDYVKLLKQLKSSVDFQVKLNITSPVAFGVLCEGFCASIIQMKIAEDGVYLATTLRKCEFPRNSQSLICVPRTVECFLFMMEELESLELRHVNRDKGQVTVEHDFIKESFFTTFQ